LVGVRYVGFDFVLAVLIPALDFLCLGFDFVVPFWDLGLLQLFFFFLECCSEDTNSTADNAEVTNFTVDNSFCEVDILPKLGKSAESSRPKSS